MASPDSDHTPAARDATDCARECGQCAYRATQQVNSNFESALNDLRVALAGIATMPTRTLDERLAKLTAFFHEMHKVKRAKFPPPGGKVEL